VHALLQFHEMHLYYIILNFITARVATLFVTRGLCCRPVSVVRLSACLSRWCIISIWLKISSNFFVGPIAPSF